jgi:hypothetical protein
MSPLLALSDMAAVISDNSSCGRGRYRAGSYRRHTKKRVRIASIRYPSLAQQPGVDHLPFIASIRSKLQKWRMLILQVVKKLERVPGACRPRIDILGLKPTIPLPQNQIFPFGLSHWLRVPSHKGEALEGWIHRAGFLECGLSSRPLDMLSKRQPATAAPVSTFPGTMCWRVLNHF